MTTRNVRIDGAGLTVIPATKGSLLYVGDFGILTEDNANLKWDDVAKALTVNKWSIGGDVFLERDAANTLALRNGVSAQLFNLYNTYTDASNYERLGFIWGSNIFQIATQASGTGSTRAIRLQSNVGGSFGIGETGSSWNVSGSNLVAGTDNTNDIGASGASRPRTGYFGTSLILGDAAYINIDGNTVGRNGIQISGTAIGSGPNITAIGGDTNINLNLSAKGTGRIAFNTFGGSSTQFVVASTASAVNYLQATGGSTGFRPVLSTQGSDAAVGMEFQVQGASDFNFFTGGFRQLLIGYTASANRYVTLTGSNGGNPTIDVSAGALKLSAGTSDIQWGKANVALGGGAAPTVGTIGGAGPAAAAQRNWLRFLESDGTASFIPVWR